MYIVIIIVVVVIIIIARESGQESILHFPNDSETAEFLFKKMQQTNSGTLELEYLQSNGNLGLKSRL